MNGRLVLALVFLVGGAGVALAGAQPQASLTPAQALEAGEGSARVKGEVASVDRQAGTFTMEGEGEALTVAIDAVPSAVVAGKSLLAEGELEHRGDELVFVASEIQMGCPSKY